MLLWNVFINECARGYSTFLGRQFRRYVPIPVGFCYRIVDMLIDVFDVDIQEPLGGNTRHFSHLAAQESAPELRHFNIRVCALSVAPADQEFPGAAAQKQGVLEKFRPGREQDISYHRHLEGPLPIDRRGVQRSEEHTSELQSLRHL